MCFIEIVDPVSSITEIVAVITAARVDERCFVYTPSRSS